MLELSSWVSVTLLGSEMLGLWWLWKRWSSAPASPCCCSSFFFTLTLCLTFYVCKLWCSVEWGEWGWSGRIIYNLMIAYSLKILLQHPLTLALFITNPLAQLAGFKAPREAMLVAYYCRGKIYWCSLSSVYVCMYIYINGCLQLLTFEGVQLISEILLFS